MFHAQFGEDKTLCGLLKHCGYPERPGIYIDIGAWDPAIDSVTKHFYDTGWRGINVEPVPYYYELLKAQRPGDVNFLGAVGEVDGFRDFSHIVGTGLSTFRQDYVERFSQGRSVEVVRTQVLTLKQLCNQFLVKLTGVANIDFLKIDVEGTEREVLVGGDWWAYRPTILCIEATEPGTHHQTAIPAWDTWDKMVRDFGYDFLEFDGLNRFYRSKETMP